MLELFSGFYGNFVVYDKQIDRRGSNRDVSFDADPWMLHAVWKNCWPQIQQATKIALGQFHPDTIIKDQIGNDRISVSEFSNEYFADFTDDDYQDTADKIIAVIEGLSR